MSVAVQMTASPLTRHMDHQSTELIRGPPELHVLIYIWFYIARLSQRGEGGGNFLFQMISTCLP
jgi:hypothetical protein